MIRNYVRAAYGLGYAEYAAEPTEEAIAQCAFLLEIAPEFGDNIVEAARNLAKMQALKDTLSKRRDALNTKYGLLLAPIYKQLARDTAAKVVKAVQPKEDAQQDKIKAILVAAGVGGAIAAILHKAWQDSNAEGHAAAQAYTAVTKDLPAVSLDHAAAASGIGDIQLNDANAWIDKMLGGQAYFVGNDLSDAIAAGKSYDDLLDIAQQAIGSGDGADLMLDTMIATGVSDGSIDQYQDEGVDQVDIITSAVDDECSDAADDNPWDIADADGMVPFHPNCRCAVAPHLG